MKYYLINNPDGKGRSKVYLDKERCIPLGLEELVNEWEGYCNDNWLNNNGFNSAEDRVKSFLDRCADSILQGQYGSSDVIEPRREQNIFKNEISMNTFFADEELSSAEPEVIIQYINTYIRDRYKNDGIMLKDYDTVMKQRNIDKHKKRCNIDKFNDIYGSNEKVVDEYIPKHISNTFSVWTVEDKIIAERGFLIDKKRSYTHNWSTVNTLNEFNFNGRKFKMDECIKGYSQQWRNSRYDDYRDDYKMEKILCYEQDGEYYFFDQNIDRIPNKYITEL